MHFSSDKTMSPFKYYLSRSDKQAKDRHSSTAHDGIDSNLIQFVSTDAICAKEAMNAYTLACIRGKRQEDQLKQLPHGHSVNDSGTSNSGVDENKKRQSEEQLDKGISYSMEEKKANNSQTSSFEGKIDKVILMLNKLSTKLEESKKVEIPEMSTILQEQSKDGLISDVDWSKLENIIDLTTKVPSVRFFAGAGPNGKKGCVRCQVCFDYLCSHDNGLRKCDPLVLETDDHGEAAAKHIRKYISLLFTIFILMR